MSKQFLKRKSPPRIVFERQVGVISLAEMEEIVQ